MERMKQIIRMKALIEQLNKYSYEYYTLGQPSVSDETYDHYYDELVVLEEETGIILSNSPTQKVGNTTLTGLKKVVHKYPMLSLNKTKKVEELEKFINNKDSVIMLKMDGLTVDLTYDKNGTLIRGETRGDGEVGEDITHNVKCFSNVPLRINYQGNDELHIIGEAIIDYDTFDEINKKIESNDEKIEDDELKERKYKNPRNLVSGTVRQLNSRVCKERQVKFIGYIVEGVDLSSKLAQLKFIEELGFETVYYMKILKEDGREYLESTIEKLKERASKLKYPIDGLVVQYNDIEYGKSLGRTLHHPNHSLAFKFLEGVEETTLRNIILQVGRTGIVTPVADFDPVELEGTTVSRATINNLSFLEELELGINDTITVKKANAIIPQIVDNITKSGTYKPPMVCPECGEPLTIKQDTDRKFLMCTNELCPAQNMKAIAHYCSRKGMNIKGISEKTLTMFISKGYIKDTQDLYYLAKDDCKYKDEIIHIKGYGKKSFDNLVKAINESKQCKLSNFIYALGIPNVGEQTAKDLVKFAKGETSLDTLNNIISMTYNDLLKMPNCGDVLAYSVLEWFSDKFNLEMISYLTQCELTFIEDEKPIVNDSESTNGVFQGKKIYCTGSFECGKKDELTAMVENAGGVFAGGYAKSLDYLVVGKKKGSGKVDRAIEDGVPVLTEDEFLKMIK